jgi:hypothetical protein
MATFDNVVLVEIETITTPDGQERAIIKRVLRSYDGKGRSDEDIDLLKQVCPDRRFEVQPVSYVDR